MSSLKLLHSYLTKRRQSVKINSTYSSWSEILFGVPQVFLVHFYLIFFLCGLFLVFFYVFVFFLYPTLALRAVLMTIFLTPPKNILKLYLKDFEQGFDILFKWFTDNLLKANPEKYHLLVSLFTQMKKDI